MATGGQDFDLAVVGLGIAGRALASRAAAAGLRVLGIDRTPERVPPKVLGALASGLPGWLDASAVAAGFVPEVRALTRRSLGEPYVVFDNAALARTLLLDGVVVRRGDLEDARARVVVDVRGPVFERPGTPHQTAFGLVLPAERAEPVLDGAPGWFMDWAGQPAAGRPSFCYAVPTGPDTVLVQETDLAGLPALPVRTLEQRLRNRLAAAGVRLSGDEPVDRVVLPLAPPLRATATVLPFGARAFLHPATGYSIADALAAVDPFISRVVAEEAPQAVLPGRAATALRLVGQRALLTMDAAELQALFEQFFALAPEDRRAYLSTRTDSRTLAAVMARLFRASPAPVRRRLIRGVVPR